MKRSRFSYFPLGPTLRPAELQAAHADGVVKRVQQHISHVDRSPAEKGAFVELRCGQTSICLTGPARSQRR